MKGTTMKAKILDAVKREREYQDIKHGCLADHPHTVAEWILIMESELNEAKEAWVRNGGDRQARKEILQVIATGFACLEQHGIVERDCIASSL
jgi:hypothetical protein